MQLIFGGVILGALMAMSQAPFNFWPFIFVIPALVICYLAWSREARLGLAGFSLGVGYFGVTLSWLINPFLVEPRTFLLLAPFAIMAMTCAKALFWAVAFWLSGKITQRVPGLNFPLCLALIWGLFEGLRGNAILGFPWVLPAQALIDVGTGQLLAIFGPFGVSFLIFALAALPSLNIRWGTLLALALLALSMIWGEMRLREDLRFHDFKIAALQPNVPQSEKWSPAHKRRHFLSILETVRETDDADLIVLPETALTITFGYDFDAQEEVQIAASSTALISGLQSYRDQRVYNSIAFFPSGMGAPEVVYDKHHLVPFGEYIPGASFLNASLGTDIYTGFAAGSPPESIDLRGIPAFLPQICYEGIFSHYASSKTRPEWILQITNDAWFGNFSGPMQHFAIARMRSLEQGLPMLRVANTGQTSMIGPYGQEVGGLIRATKATLLTALPQSIDETFYAKYGRLIPFSIYLAFALFLFLQAKRPLRN